LDYSVLNDGQVTTTLWLPKSVIELQEIQWRWDCYTIYNNSHRVQNIHILH